MLVVIHLRYFLCNFVLTKYYSTTYLHSLDKYYAGKLFYVLTKWDNWYSEINGYKLFTHYLLSRWSGVKGPWYFWWGICSSKAHKPVTLLGNPTFRKSLLTCALEGKVLSQKKSASNLRKKMRPFFSFTYQKFRVRVNHTIRHNQKTKKRPKFGGSFFLILNPLLSLNFCSKSRISW